MEAPRNFHTKLVTRNEFLTNVYLNIHLSIKVYYY